MMEESDRLMIGLRALLGDVAEEPDWPDSEGRMLEGKLDLYVSDELDGVDVHTRHPQLWRHLQTRTSGRQEHDSLLDILAAEARGELGPLPFPRPAAPVPVDLPWRVTFNLPGTAKSGLYFVFAPACLRENLRPAGMVAGLRVAEQRPTWNTLLLSYCGNTPSGEVMVQVYARLDVSDPASCSLTVVASAEPMPRAVELTWGGRTWEAELTADGHYELGPVPLAALETSDLSTEAFALRLLG